MADDPHLRPGGRPGLDKAYKIPANLYDKALKHNDQLTEDERALLLSRGDVVGKALAHPESLSLEERYHVLQWSPPDKLHAAIRTATDGALSMPEELYACVARTGGFAQLAPEAQRIVEGMFLVDQENAPHCFQPWIETPGNSHATSLLYDRASINFSFLMTVSFFFRVPAHPLDIPLTSPDLPPELQESLATIPRPPPVVPPPQVEDHVREASRRAESVKQQAKQKELRKWRENHEREREREMELAKERGEWPRRRRRYSHIKPHSGSDEISRLMRQVVAKPE